MANGQDEAAGCGCLLLIAVLVAGFVGIRGCARRMSVSSFDPYLAEYVSLAVTGGDAVENSAFGYIRGKAVIVDRHKRQIDPIYFSLNDNIRAVEPEEVGTVILTEWSEDRVGTYTDGASAFVHVCKLSLVDKSVPRIVGQNLFRVTGEA